MELKDNVLITLIQFLPVWDKKLTMNMVGSCWSVTPDAAGTILWMMIRAADEAFVAYAEASGFSDHQWRCFKFPPFVDISPPKIYFCPQYLQKALIGLLQNRKLVRTDFDHATYCSGLS